MPTPKNKRKFALWLYPETLEKIGQLYTADDCRSKSESVRLVQVKDRPFSLLWVKSVAFVQSLIRGS